MKVSFSERNPPPLIPPPDYTVVKYYIPPLPPCNIDELYEKVVSLMNSKERYELIDHAFEITRNFIVNEERINRRKLSKAMVSHKEIHKVLLTEKIKYIQECLGELF